MGNLPLTAAHRIGCNIKSSLAADCKQCAANAASTVECHLSNGAVKEVWQALKGVASGGRGLPTTSVS